MKTKWTPVIAASLLLIAVALITRVLATGTLTETAPAKEGRITSYDMTITSATDGTASVTTTYPIGAPILQVILMPGSGTAEPNDLFDVTINDPYSRDILVGEGADLSNSVNTSMVPRINGELVIVNGLLTVDVNNAGPSNTVRLILMYEERQ